MSQRTVTISVIGVSGKESIKGTEGVGKSALCNRFIRSCYDDFIIDHSSVLSQTDFGGSPVINNDHWLYWGERYVDNDDGASKVNVRIIEQTEFLDDETFDTLAGSSTAEPYNKRAVRTKLESRDKLMYIRKEQLGLETEFPQNILPEGKCTVDCFIYVFDSSKNDRSFDNQVNASHILLTQALKTKKPVVIAVTKCDIYDEDCKRALQNLLTKKELRGAHLPIVETSAFTNVNVDELFSFAVSNVFKAKARLKLQSYYETEKINRRLNLDKREAFSNLLNCLLPKKDWPRLRLSWSSFIRTMNLDHHSVYCDFVHTYGVGAAKKMYDIHVNEARDFWMAYRLEKLQSELPRVFDALLDRSSVPDLTWNEAKQIIHSHALFDEHFQPLGTLGKNLDPLSSENPYEDPIADSRIPAEILLRKETRVAFDDYQKKVEMEFRKERLEEDFEAILQECPQVTPGKPLQEVCIFLQEYDAYKLLAPAQTTLIYDRYQNILKKRAEKEFSECLHEHIELFIESLKSKKCVNAGMVSETHFNRIKDYLQEDNRFRLLSRMFKVRDSMIHQFISFMLNPSSAQCASRTKCSDVMLLELIDLFFQKRQKANESNIHLVDITVHGDMPLVAQFITDLNRLLRNEPFLCASGYANIRCFGPEESESVGMTRTQLYLLDTPQCIEDHRAYYLNRKDLTSNLPPIFVLVCDPGHYDLLPTMHQQGYDLAQEADGIFIGAGSAESNDSSCSRASDCSSIFGRDQLYRVCETVCSSQLDCRRCDLRVRASILCGDSPDCESFLSCMFPPNSAEIRPLVNTSLLSAGIIPVDICSETGNPRVDIILGSYHNWLFTKTNAPIHGHIFIFYTRRAASYAFARTALTKVLDNGRYSVPGKAILLVAISDIHDHCDDEGSNVILTSASELAHSVGCSFIVINPDSPNDLTTTRDFLRFIVGLKDMIPAFGDDYYERTRVDSDGYATFAGSPKSSKDDISIESSAQSLSCTAPSVITNCQKMSMSSNSETRSQIATGSPQSSLAGVPSIPGSNNSKPRRRPPPVNVALKIPGIRPAEVAPLATPEAVELAPEYSQTQDALTDDDNVYATADFITPVKPDDNINALLNKKEKKSNIRSWMFSQSNSSGSVQPCSSVFSYTSVEKTPSRTAPLLLIPASSSAEKRLPILITPTNLKSASNQAEKLPRSSKPCVKAFNIPRSVTASFISRDPVAKLRQSMPVRSSLRQSISAESLNDINILLEKKKKNKEFGGSRFVRKVATSFRFKKNEVKLSEHDSDKDDDPKSLSVPESQPSRSLPQSPHTERRVKKHVYGGGGTEKTSGAFSWLPSISPRRSTKSLASEQTSMCTRSPSDTIHSLTSEGGDIPIFLKRCVDFIEEEGGLELEGLYRVPGNQAQVLELEKYFKDKGDLDLTSLNLPVHVVATAVKNFFSNLPEPLITYNLHESLLNSLCSPDIENQYKDILASLPAANLLVISYFFRHLHKVASSPSTAMDLVNLSKVWFPTFFRPNFDNFDEMSNGMSKYQRAMETILIHSNEIFDS
ncbi:unnamed protein product [Auanema sp. JU1783]|nr:unnamed protein product [Auanema sp. JU1783]